MEIGVMDLGQSAERKLNLSTIRIGGHPKHLVEIHHALAFLSTNACKQTITRPRYPSAPPRTNHVLVCGKHPPSRSQPRRFSLILPRSGKRAARSCAKSSLPRALPRAIGAREPLAGLSVSVSNLVERDTQSLRQAGASLRHQTFVVPAGIKCLNGFRADPCAAGSTPQMQPEARALEASLLAHAHSRARGHECRRATHLNCSSSKT